MNLYKSPKLRPNLRIWETGNEQEQQEPNKLCTWTSSVEFLRSTGSFGFYRIQVPSLDIFNIFGGIYNFSFSVDPIIKIFYDPITCRINLCPLKVFQIRYSLSWEQRLPLSFLTTMVPSCLWLSDSPVLVLSQGLWTCSFFYSHHHSPGFHIAGSFSAFRSQSSQLYPSSFSLPPADSILFFFSCHFHSLAWTVLKTREFDGKHLIHIFKNMNLILLINNLWAWLHL